MNALLPAKVLVASIVSAWLLALIILIVMPPRPRKRVVARLGGFVWTREDFYRGWLITGDTGSGKTRSGITLLLQVFTNEPTWGGLCIDDKGSIAIGCRHSHDEAARGLRTHALTFSTPARWCRRG